MRGRVLVGVAVFEIVGVHYLEYCWQCLWIVLSVDSAYALGCVL